jgi:hypothetical protein
MRRLELLVGFLLCTLCSALFLPAKAFAQNEFSVDSTVTYAVADSGKTIVTHEITLENNFSTLYATTYTLSLENIQADNIKAYYSTKQLLTTDIEKVGNKTDIKATFPDAVVGRGAKRHFFISYENSTFALRTGEVWEVSIPRLGDQNTFRNYKILLKVPDSFGLEAYISPKPSSSSDIDGFKNYTFTKDDILQAGITAGFGQFQVFSFNLTYHLENPSDFCTGNICSIALPPDTAFQKVYLQKVDPKPTAVAVSKDGNWIAAYNLSPKQRIDVKVSGSVQIFASYRPFPKTTDQILNDNLKGTNYWQIDNLQIKTLARELKTPKAIYDYVSTNLKYDFNRVQPNIPRMGAVNALQNPAHATCMEFTDLFITLARAAGIPAREVNGYSYTENPQLQPLSLVADVLHAWPEYYDKDKGSWIPVDPTWASTSGGIDYFNKLDLRHFTFVIHGESAVTPYPPGSYKLASNPQKDVFVSFGKLPENRITTPVISITPVRLLPFLDSIYNIKIANPGPAALYSTYPVIYFDGREKSRDFIDILPPYAVYDTQINVPFSLFGKGTPSVIEVRADGAKAAVTTNKTQIIINSLLVASVLLILIVLAVLIRLRKIKFDRLSATIHAIYAKFTRRHQKNSPSGGPPAASS